MSNTVRRGELYPLADGEQAPSGFDPKLTRARWTGEHRPALRGEWFLSGAIVEAYAATDGEAESGFPRHIAELIGVHKAIPGKREHHCGVCGQSTRTVAGGRGPTLVHADSGAVAAPNPS